MLKNISQAVKINHIKVIVKYETSQILLEYNNQTINTLYINKNNNALPIIHVKTNFKTFKSDFLISLFIKQKITKHIPTTT